MRGAEAMPSSGSDSYCVRLETLSSQEVLRHDALRACWRELLRLTDQYSLSQTYEYCVAGMGGLALGEGWLVLAWRGRDLVGVWPLVLRRAGNLRFLRTLSCGTYEEYSAPLVRSDQDTKLIEQMFRHVATMPADVMQVIAVRGGGPAHRFLARDSLGVAPAVVRAFTSYELALTTVPSWDAFLAGRSKSFRSGLRYDAKALAERGEVIIGWCETVEDADAVIAWICDQKRAWARERRVRTPWIFDGQVGAFFKRLAREVDLQAMPLVAFVKVDGVPVAASINIVGSRALEYYITTFDPAFGKFSPGKMLIEFLARWSLEADRDLDFRAMKADYKDRWADQCPELLTYTIYLTHRGRLYGARKIKAWVFQSLGKVRRLLLKRQV